jgi:hypothetical protein
MSSFFAKIFVCLNVQTQDQVSQTLVTILQRSFESDVNVEQPLVFCVHMYLSLSQHQLNTVHEKTLLVYLRDLIVKSHGCNIDPTEYLNESLEILHQTLGFDEAKQATESRTDNVLSNERFYEILHLIKRLSGNFTSDFNNFKFNDLNANLYLLSVLESETFWLAKNEGLISFVAFLKRILLQNYSIEFDSYFIMLHQLYGFEQLVYKVILSETRTKPNADRLNLNEVLILELASNSLKTTKFIISILKTLNCTVAPDVVHDRLKALFWSIFNSLPFDAKLSLIESILNTEELKKADDGSIVCLTDKSFNKQLLKIANQLSSENIDDTNVRH